MSRPVRQDASRKIGTLAGIAFVTLVAMPVSPARADLVIKQESNGFPGAEADGSMSQQIVSVREDRLRIFDAANFWALYVDLKDKVVREASGTSKTFTERSLSAIEEMRRKRAESRAKQVEEFNQIYPPDRDDREAREAKKAFDAKGLSRDGKTIAKLQPFEMDTTEWPVVVDGKRVWVPVFHYKIRESSAAKPAFDVWIAPSLKDRSNLLTFWRAVGPFSDEVLAKLAELPKGFPLQIEAYVDDGSMGKTIRAKVFEIRDEKVDSADYGVPAGFKKREPNERAAPVNQTVKCEICGKELKLEEAKVVQPTPESENHYACDQKHQLELLRKLGRAPGQPPGPPTGGRGGGAPPAKGK